MNTNRKRTGDHYPLDNLTYDLMTIIHKKSKGLEAFDKYIEDAKEDKELRQLLEEIRQQDEECITMLQPYLSRRLGESRNTATTEDNKKTMAKASGAGAAGRSSGGNKVTANRSR
jgi:meiotically up-regulated gene 157 (Mug157) protein